MHLNVIFVRPWAQNSSKCRPALWFTVDHLVVDYILLRLSTRSMRVAPEPARWASPVAIGFQNQQLSDNFRIQHTKVHLGTFRVREHPTYISQTHTRVTNEVLQTNDSKGLTL